MYTYGGIYEGLALNQGPNIAMDYWTLSLFQRLTAIFDIKNLPKRGRKQYEWDKDALKYGLLKRGFLAVFDSASYGIVPQPCTLTGFSLQYQPAAACVATPYFDFKEPLRIGTQCELLKLTPNYMPLWGIITKYAAELKEIDTSIKAAARNSRLAFALVADSDKTKRTLQAIRERVINGEDAIIDSELLKRDKVNNSDVPWFTFNQDIKNNYILGNLLEARRDTLRDFYKEIGVRVMDPKKERLVTEEAEASSDESYNRSEVWIETLKESCDKINRLYGLNLVPVLNAPDQPKEGASDVR